jgi:hypothetical protein
MANEVVRDPERLEFYFSASLSAAQSAHYVMASSFKSFNDAKEKWENSLPLDGAGRFNWVIELRVDDAHFAVSKPQEKYIEQRQRWDEYAYLRRYNPALFGVEGAPVVEEINPDGTKVTGPNLRGTVGLYRDLNGCLEATTVCREFIDLLRSLLEATRAAVAP